MITIASSKEYRDLSPSQIVPKLADTGKYVASESTFYRILREEKMLAHRGKQLAPKRHKPDELIATAPNQVWSWDITFLRSNIAGMFFYLYLVMDVFSRKIVGHEVHYEQSQELSSLMIERICGNEGIDGNQIVLHADNGGPMKGATMLATLQRLGVATSFSRPSVSDDNPYSESLFKTLKYRPNYPSRPFASIEEADAWVEKFKNWYNTEHLHSGVRFVTPESRHDGKDGEILQKRLKTYEGAKARHPNRWSGKIRNWNRIEVVRLNPLHGKEVMSTRNAA